MSSMVNGQNQGLPSEAPSQPEPKRKFGWWRIREFVTRQETVLVFLILSIALILRLLTWERYLPFIDYVDEPNMVWLTQSWRGLEQVAHIPEWLAGYPPLYMWIAGLVQPIVEWGVGRPWVFTGEYVGAMRLVSVAAGVFTTAILYMLGKRSGGVLAGLFAALLWAISPVVVASNSFAIPDPLVYMTTAFTLWCVVEAWPLDKRWCWHYGMLIGVIATIYLKYSALYVVIPYAMVMLRQLVQRPRGALKHLAIHALIGLAALAYLAFVHHAFDLSNNEAGRIRGTGIGPALAPERWLHNMAHALAPIAGGEVPAGTFDPVTIDGGVLGLALGLAVAGIASYLFCRTRRAQTISLASIALLMATILGGLIAISLFVWAGTFAEYRHVLPLTVPLAVCVASAIAQVGYVLDVLWTPKVHKFLRPSALVVGFAALLVLIFSLSPNTRLIADLRRIDARQVLWEWADLSLPADGRILMTSSGQLDTAFNRHFGGYDGAAPFDWWLEDREVIVSATADEYAERGILYLALSDLDRHVMEADARWAEFIGGWTLLKEVATSSSIAGDGFQVFRASKPEHKTGITFGDEIMLAGYDLFVDEHALTGTVQPGQSITFRPYWRIVTTPSSNYSTFVHFASATEEAPIAQADGAPASPLRSTLTWDDHSELIIGTSFTIVVPEDAPLGRYELRVGLYDYVTGQRLQTATGDSLVIPVGVAE